MAAISYWRVPRQTLFRFEERGKLAGQECLGKMPAKKKLLTLKVRQAGGQSFTL